MASINVVTAGTTTKGGIGIDQASEASLKAAADMVTGKLKSAVPVDTGQLRDSIRPTNVKKSGFSMSVEVYPHDTRRKSKRQKKSVRNAEVGFIHEYGTSKVKASHWMRNTVDSCESEIVDIIERRVGAAMEDAALAALDIGF